MDKITRNLLFHQILSNPLPWEIDRHWTYEVKASNGTIIAKCSTHDEAQEIIEAAKKLKNELDKIDVESLLAAD